MNPYSTEFLRLFNKEEAIHIQVAGRGADPEMHLAVRQVMHPEVIEMILAVRDRSAASRGSQDLRVFVDHLGAGAEVGLPIGKQTVPKPFLPFTS